MLSLDVRPIAAGLAACVALAAPGLAQAKPIGARSVTGATAQTPSTPSGPVAASGARIGDTPADFGRPAGSGVRAGDTPVDFPGASRAVEYVAPTTVEVIRPERTIVREVDEALPTILASVALALALGGAGFTILRTRALSRTV
jgi:hypothetical protein